MDAERKGPMSSDAYPAKFKGYGMHTLPNGLVEVQCGRDSCCFHFASRDPKLLVYIMNRVHPRFCLARTDEWKRLKLA